MTSQPLPFFVYGTLRPGQYNHHLFLRGRTAAEEPATLAGALLYDGPGYPYVIEERRAGEGAGAVVGDLVIAAPAEYGELLSVLDTLEEFYGPGHPLNVYDRVARDAVRPDGTAVRAWVYVAAARVERELRRNGDVIPGGDWLNRGPGPRPSPVRRGPRTP
ncbi:gamma-glutamylcyclotransferase [Streptomyces sp. A3M-1-3]|uniref:gamma-glutamylcyclotransferase family protein n=1 Tax=Streptomyces sp. A3M-1-3 TaxID=2962044 RepID=UPI0020B690E9|nr:gamma-glutamylcyclotransferase family protein [Streptomyces sp. A3M-1-3]MCP3817604.1 gamma-glutamylcyclotransferase [Streptomyces sp. A3M-1-3]